MPGGLSQQSQLSQQLQGQSSAMSNQGTQQQPGGPMASSSGGNAPPPGMPSPADLSLMLSLGLGLNPSDANQLANLDLQKLAQILVSIIR